MKTECMEEKMGFQGHEGRKVEGSFTGGRLTGKAGGVLLRELEERTGLIERFAACFVDNRTQSRVEHSVLELIKQRVYSLILGDEDLNDHDELCFDQFLALLSGKSDLTGQGRRKEAHRGQPLASRSTLSRFERGGIKMQEGEKYEKITVNEQKLTEFFFQEALSRYPKAPKRVVIDFDPSDVETHGKQPESSYNSYYKHNCLLPLYVFLDNKWPLMVQLRGPSVDPAFELFEQIRPVLDGLRAHWGEETHILLRGDSGFSHEELMREVEKRKARGEKIDFVFAKGKNPRLVALGRSTLEEAEALYKASGKSERAFGEFMYQTKKSWSRERRIIAKAEASLVQSSVRFLVTSLEKDDAEARELYEDEYCPRGQMENCIKEQQLDLFGTRLPSTSFEANQLRLHLVALSHLIIALLRDSCLQDTELARASAGTIRQRLLLVAAQVRISARRIFLALDETFTRKTLFYTIYRRLTASLDLPSPAVR